MKKGTFHTQESKDKIREKLEGRKRRPESVRKGVITRMERYPIWTSSETREKLRRAQEGKKHSEETKAKIRESKKKHKDSLEVRGRKSWARKMFTHSEETKAKISASMIAYHARKDSPQVNLDHEVSDTMEELKATQKRKKEHRRMNPY